MAYEDAINDIITGFRNGKLKSLELQIEVFKSLGYSVEMLEVVEPTTSNLMGHELGVAYIDVKAVY